MVKQELQTAEYITITTDTWTSLTIDSYMAVTAHFISSKWEMVSYTLDCLHFTERHTAQNLKNELINIFECWDISSKVHTVVTDNAANIASAIRETDYYHWPCFAHTINLVVQGGMKVIQDLQLKVKCIVKYFHKSTVAKEKLHSIQRSINPGDESLSLINDVVTRWNSTYYMFSRILHIQESVEAAIGMLHNPVETLSEIEWKVLKEVCVALKPFEEISIELSAEKNVTISKVIIMIQGLKRCLSSLKNKVEQNLTQYIIDEFLSQLNERFHQIELNPVLSRPTFLDPRFKAKAFENQHALESVKENIISNMKRICSEYDNKSSISPTTISHNNNDEENVKIAEENKSSNLIWAPFIHKVAKSTDHITNSTTAILKMRQFIEESYINIKDDPLIWWKTREHSYPGLSEQAKRHLGVVATSVPSERVFSLAGQVISDRRTRLLPENARMIIFLNSNKHLLD